jgi:hypothetical protein
MLEFLVVVSLEAEGALPSRIAHPEQIVPVVQRRYWATLGDRLGPEPLGDQIAPPAVRGRVAERSGKPVGQRPGPCREAERGIDRIRTSQPEIAAIVGKGTGQPAAAEVEVSIADLSGGTIEVHKGTDAAAAH